MSVTVKNDTGRILGAIIAGCVSATLVAILFTPVIYIVFSNFLVIDLRDEGGGAGTNVVVVLLTFGLWAFFTMMAGEYVSARIALQNEYHLAWTIVGIGAVILFIYFSIGFPGTLMILIIGTLGAHCGCHTGIQYKQKQNRGVQTGQDGR